MNTCLHAPPTASTPPAGLGRAQPALAPPVVHSVLASPGRPLEPAVRAEMEPRFRHSFADVRVHADGRAAESARAVAALAYTVGRDVVFAAGRYAPESAEGKRLIAHELAHVVQQAGAPASLQPRLEVGAVDDPAEREADVAADRVMAGAAAETLPRGAQALRRTCDCRAIPGARVPTAEEDASMAGDFPHLRRGDWCITAEEDSSYNCYAWTLGLTSRRLDEMEIDTRWGDRNGQLEIGDFDRMYRAYGMAAGNDTTAEVALYATAAGPVHAARRHPARCGFTFESKLGRSFRIVHDARQLEGGLYGSIVRYYGRPLPTMLPPRAAR